FHDEREECNARTGAAVRTRGPIEAIPDGSSACPDVTGVKRGRGSCADDSHGARQQRRRALGWPTRVTPMRLPLGRGGYMLRSVPSEPERKERREWKVGDVVGDRYELRSELGKGAGGLVFEAVHRFTQRS